MMLPMLIVAVLGGAAQEAPAAAPAPQAAEAVSTGSADAEIEAGLKAFRRRQFRQARAAFERAVAAAPNSAAAHFYLGYTIYKIAEPRTHDAAAKRESLEHFAEAFRLDPQFKPNWRG
jgi:Tfp pilus assembly protein PilF